MHGQTIVRRVGLRGASGARGHQPTTVGKRSGTGRAAGYEDHHPSWAGPGPPGAGGVRLGADRGDRRGTGVTPGAYAAHGDPSGRGRGGERCRDGPIDDGPVGRGGSGRGEHDRCRRGPAPPAGNRGRRPGRGSRTAGARSDSGLRPGPWSRSEGTRCGTRPGVPRRGSVVAVRQRTAPVPVRTPGRGGNRVRRPGRGPGHRACGTAAGRGS